MKELLVASNPDPGSKLAYLLRVPLGEGVVLRTSGTWPRTKALYCHPVTVDEWPDEPDIVEAVPLRTCTRRGAAIEIVADRFRENRSQIVYTTARGRQAVFWQSPRTRKQARPSVVVPTARAMGIPILEIVVDAHERYPYRFANERVAVSRRALPCGDYGIVMADNLVATVERKSLPDLVASVSNGRLRYALGELAGLPRAAVVVEDRYSELYKQRYVRPSVVADALAECQVRWPQIPIVFCETRSLAEDWTYRYLAAAYSWAVAEQAAVERITGVALGDADALDAGSEDSHARPIAIAPRRAPGDARAAEIRTWARAAGMPVPERGRIPNAVRAAWEDARDHP